MIDDQISRGAEAISDLLTMLGVNPDERPEHGGPSTAETLAAAVVNASREQPKASSDDVAGIFGPDWTGGMSSVDWVRGQRDDT